MLIMLNCHDRNYTEIYNRFDVFFDLDRTKHLKEKENLYPNAICCVLSYVDLKKKLGEIDLSFWQYRELVEHNAENSWFLVGVPIGRTRIPKSELKANPDFCGVIAADGDFNQFTLRRTI